jgi:hypothetical protein
MTYSLFQLVATGIIGAMLGAVVAAAIVWHLWEARERGYTEMLTKKDNRIAALNRHFSPPAAGPSSDGGTADLKPTRYLTAEECRQRGGAVKRKPNAESEALT